MRKRIQSVRKKRRITKKTKRISDKNETIYKKNISIKDFSNELYSYFKNMKLNPKHNFITFQSDRKGNQIKFKFISKINHKYNSNPKWEDIHCQEQVLGHGGPNTSLMIIKTNCDININGVWQPAYISDPRFYKVFVKGYKNLYDYILAIKKNKINKLSNSLLFNKLLNNLKMINSYKHIKNGGENDRKLNLINHNLDVKTLHFKYM